MLTRTVYKVISERPVTSLHDERSACIDNKRLEFDERRDEESTSGTPGFEARALTVRLPRPFQQ